MPNHLAKERSVYLKAHAEQAIDWHPWGEEALTLARQSGKPILLSIGYNACHWCHVMAREAFSDPATVAAMNEGFINIKVDREERPDIDLLYQTAHTLLRRSTGGWPLTLFLSPQGMPFYSGTYFPHEAQGDQPAFKDILASVSRVWTDKRKALAQQDQALLDQLMLGVAMPQEGLCIDASTEAEAATQLAVAFDAQHGGFGHAPKFPHPTDLAWLLDKAAAGDALARDMALTSLRKMADGGLFDQIGGGFFRYSVDAEWHVPHFEKMLCDNALLLSLYARAYALTQEAQFARVVDLTVGWLLREMRLPSGLFKASQPADDAQGHEGGSYTWLADDLRKALTPMEWDVCSAHWGLIDAPRADGRWHLRVARPVGDLARTLDRPAAMLQELVDGTRDKLRALRDQRPAAAPDTQVLTSWNALLITALAQAGALCEQRDWIDLARDTLDALKHHVWTGQGKLLSRPPIDGYLDDHAFLLEAALAVHAAAPRDDDMAFAHVLANTLIDRFEDTLHGGFFMSPNDMPPLFFKLKPGADMATPSGNGTAALALLALNRLAPQPRYLTAASRCVQAFAGTVRKDPASHPRLLAAAAATLRP